MVPDFGNKRGYDLNMPRQSFNKTYLPNGVIDIYRKEFILKNKVLLGKRCKAFITDFSQEIDTMDDLKYLKKIESFFGVHKLILTKFEIGLEKPTLI